MFHNTLCTKGSVSHIQLLAAGALALCATTGVGVARASTLFVGSGLNPETGSSVAGTAAFAISGNNLTLVLTNTTSPRTTAQGDALTGVTFDVSAGSPPLALTSIILTAGSALWTSKLSSTTSPTLAGSWTDVLGGSPLAAYGVATTGFNNRFNGGSITLGNASPDYGIVAANTFNGTNVAFGGSQFPFAQDSLTFTFSGASGVSESQIANVDLLFGTDGTGIVTTVPVPEPSSAAMWGVAGFLAARRRR